MSACARLQSLLAPGRSPSRSTSVYRLWAAADLAALRGSFHDAEALATEHVRLATQVGDVWERAAALTAVAGVREEIGGPLTQVETEVLERLLAPARARLDKISWNRAWDEGRSMSFEEAVTMGLAHLPLRMA